MEPMKHARPKTVSTGRTGRFPTLFFGGLLAIGVLYWLAFGQGADRNSGSSENQPAQSEDGHETSRVSAGPAQRPAPDQAPPTRVRNAPDPTAQVAMAITSERDTLSRSPAPSAYGTPETANASPAAPTFASNEIIQQRLQDLFGNDGQIEPVRIDGARIRVSGRSPSNARVSQFLRAIDQHDAAMAPELLSIAQRDGAIHFEIMLRPGALSAP